MEDPSRLAGVTSLGVDEHIWRPGRHRADRAVTGMVDLTRDRHGRVRARLLDVVLGRSGTVYAQWLGQAPAGFVEGHQARRAGSVPRLANAIRDELDDTVAVLDAFHVVQLGTKVVDEVRRRVQQATLGHRGHKDDPLYTIRGLLRHGLENLTDRQIARLDAGLAAGDPDDQVAIAWQCYQRLRSIYHARTPMDGRRIAEEVIGTFASCPVPELALAAADLLAWTQTILLGHAPELAKAEWKTIRYRLLHTAARIARSGRRTWLRLQKGWPWALALAHAFDVLRRLPVPTAA